MRATLWVAATMAAYAETQPVHRVQVPPDDAEGQPGFFPERRNQAEQVDPQDAA